MAIETKSKTESMTPITFRGYTEDRQIMDDMAVALNCTPSAVPRIALRLLKEISCTKVLTNVGWQVKVNEVIRQPNSVLRETTK